MVHARAATAGSWPREPAVDEGTCAMAEECGEAGAEGHQDG
jgi:hypothetical protein